MSSFPAGTKFLYQKTPGERLRLIHIKTTDTYAIDFRDGTPRVSITWEQLLALRLRINAYELGFKCD